MATNEHDTDPASRAVGLALDVLERVDLNVGFTPAERELLDQYTDEADQIFTAAQNRTHSKEN